MTRIERANGRRPGGLSQLLQPDLKSAPRPKPEDLRFDLDELLAAVVALTAEVPSDAYTAPMLGTEREGNGVVIDDSGLVLTIGYLIVEASEVNLTAADGRSVPAEVIAYDYDTGFGLLRALSPLDVTPMAFGTTAAVAPGDSVIVAAHGGSGQAIVARIVAKREFAGYWEYMLDEAVFTAPPHPSWSGAALIGDDGSLLGTGSLYLEEARPGSTPVPGNMFVPIDLLPAILPDMLATGRVSRDSRPWLGVFVTEAYGQLMVSAVAPGGPADRTGMRAGDSILRVAGAHVADLAEMYRKIWSRGGAGVDVPLTVLRDGNAFELVIRSTDRYALLKLRQRH